MSDVFFLPSHPVAAVFPLMNEAELGALAADIKANGLRLPIVLDHRGETIVDGRNRRDACHRAGVSPKTRCLRQDENAFDLIVSSNLRRRHLDESQRGMVAARIANLPQGTRTDLASIEAKSGGWISQGDAGGLLNVSRATVQRAKAVLEKGTPELVEAVDAGKIKLNEAERLAKPPRNSSANLSCCQKPSANPLEQKRLDARNPHIRPARPKDPWC